MYCFSCTGSEKQSSSSEVYGEEGERDDLRLLLHDQLVLLLPRVRHDALPWQFPPQEVDQHVAQRLQVVASALLDAHVVGDRRVPRRSRETLALVVSTRPDANRRVRNVFFGPWGPVPLRQTKVDDVHDVGTSAQTEDKVVGFYVTMDKITMMDELQTR